jgi:hypothetical protein
MRREFSEPRSVCGEAGEINHGRGRSSVSPGASPSTTADCEGLLVGGVRLLSNWLSPSQMKTAINHPTAIPLAAFGLVCLSIKFPSQFFEGVFGVELARSVGEFQTLLRPHPKFLYCAHGFASLPRTNVKGRRP